MGIMNQMAGVLVVYSVMGGTANAEIRLDERCDPKGMVASLHSKASPQSFWNGQLQEVDREIEKEMRWPQELQEINRIVDTAIAESQRHLEELYRRDPFSRPPPPTQAEQLRMKADEVEQRENNVLIEKYRLDRIAFLERCRSLIRRKLTSDR